MILVLITFALIALLSVPGLIRQKYWKELVVFSVLLFLGFALSSLIALGVDLPLVSEIITRVLKGILNMKG